MSFFALVHFLQDSHGLISFQWPPVGRIVAAKVAQDAIPYIGVPELSPSLPYLPSRRLIFCIAAWALFDIINFHPLMVLAR